MSLTIIAKIQCDSCRALITVKGDAGTNATEVRNIAKREYGWATSKAADRCLDHRGRPLSFHAFLLDATTNAAWARCAVCGKSDWSAKEGRDPMQPQHRRAAVEANAKELRSSGYASWS